jgi:hypothetical protein
MKSLFNSSAAALVAAGLLWSAPTRGFAQVPGGMASPLAGGPAAATGGAYMDVQGNPIVMPASYCGPGGDCGNGYGYGAMCPDQCGYGDCAGADFGGASYPDQCGPHYFDIAVQGVFLQNDDSFEDVPALASVGAGGPLILEPNELFDELEAGWQIAARYDIGPLSVIEATYMGLYDIGGSEQVFSTAVDPMGADFQLNSVFSDYGLGTLIDGLDEGSVYTLNYESDLQSTELSYRRYWVGYNPRISGTYLAGFRYIRMTEDFTFDAIAQDGNSQLTWGAVNDLVGGQIGGDGWICLRQGLRFGGEAKAGIYNNRFKYQHNTTFPDPSDSTEFSTDGNQVAFAGETTVDLVADILPSFSIRGGYQVLYMSSLVTVGNNINPEDVTSSLLFTQADALYHGFHAGLEYIW